MKTVGIVCVLVCWALTACSRQEQSLPPEVVSALEQAFNTEDIDTLASLFTEDAEIISDSEPVIRGRKDIRKFMESQITPVVSFDTRSQLSVVRDDLAFEQGEFLFRDVRRGANIELGRYIHIWKQVDGDWKLYRVMYNTNMARPVRVSVAPAS